MYNDRDMMNYGGRKVTITPGTNVYDANGDKIGVIEEYSSQANCIVVEKGLLFKKDLFIPVDAIESTRDDRTYLNLAKDDLAGDRFATPPAGYRTSPTAGMSIDDHGD